LNDSTGSGKSIPIVNAPFIPSSPADLELIAQLKTKLQYAELRIRVLEERLRLMRIEKYGAGGEKLSQAQMQLFDLEPVVSEVVVQAESEPVPRATKQSTKHPGRQELPANLLRVERVLSCTPDQRICKRCGRATVVIGYEESSQLDVEPAKYFVLVTKREKRGLAGRVRISASSQRPCHHGSLRNAWPVTASSSTRSLANMAITRPCIGRA
jgi:transposase